MDKSYSGLVIILLLVSLYVLGICLPEKKPDPLPNIPSPKGDISKVIGYDYKNKTYIYAKEEVQEIDMGFGKKSDYQETKTEVIYIEKDKPMDKKQFEYMVEDYIHDNWDDLRDKYDN